MFDNQRGFVHPKLVIGLLIIVMGVLFLLDNMDVMEAESILRYWPAFLIVIGLTMAVQPAGMTNRGAGWFLVVAGTWLLLNELDILDVSFWDAWPVLLIACGAWLIWRAVSDSSATAGSRQAAPVSSKDEPVVESADAVSIFAFLSNIERASDSKEFRGADLTAIMGGAELDLRDAAMGDEPAVIDAFAFWGGIEVKVPEDWVVINKVMPLLGGLDDGTSARGGASAKQLLVRGSAIMGGMSVSN